MEKMRFSRESYLLYVLKMCAAIFRAMPFGLALWIARCFGSLGYYILPKKRRVIYANLKIIFAGRKTPREMRRIAKNVFRNFAQSFVDLWFLPKIKKQNGFGRFVELKGWENFEDLFKPGKGMIFLAIHSGNWELASVIGSLQGHCYNIVANAHSKAPQLDALLNDYRRIAGAHVIEPGLTTRNIIKALRNNECVSLVLDQGGKDGMAVSFMGKTASMSTGAIRLGLKYGVPVCPVWITRKASGEHCLRLFPALDLPSGEDGEKSVLAGLKQGTELFEPLINEYPDEYMWFYKVFKYSTDAKILILDDGKTGHLRQSQGTAEILKSALSSHGKRVEEKTIKIDFKTPLLAKVFAVYAFCAQALRFLCREDALELFLTKESYLSLIGYAPDFIIGCGSATGGVNFILKQSGMIKSICLLSPGLVSQEQFDLVIAPQHDDLPPLKTRTVITKAALNVITPEYLKDQSRQLLQRYSHLKNSVRGKIGVLLGGDAKGVVFNESEVRSLIRQLKEAAVHYNMDILLTTSRRTSPNISALVARELKNFDRAGLCIIANEQNIPEAVGGILGLSDLLIVSGESISMVSEALCSGKRTIVFSPAGDYGDGKIANKYDRFVLRLNEQGFLTACAVKDISMVLSNMLRNKITLQTLDDHAAVRKAIEEIL